jgi:hypothetical protein
MYDTDDRIVYVRKTQCFRHNITDEKKTIDAFKKSLKNKIPPTTMEISIIILCICCFIGWYLCGNDD